MATYMLPLREEGPFHMCRCRLIPMPTFTRLEFHVGDILELASDGRLESQLGSTLIKPQKQTEREPPKQL
uniref:Uncharacterized protein n=1 Tax=Oryza meridionalis TaxID=40149 RepID=A0A0E0CA86_9ORYZ